MKINSKLAIEHFLRQDYFINTWYFCYAKTLISTNYTNIGMLQDIVVCITKSAYYARDELFHLTNPWDYHTAT